MQMTKNATRNTEDNTHRDKACPINHVCALELDSELDVQLNALERLPENCEVQGTISDP
jgi:hypothetical protein